MTALPNRDDIGGNPSRATAKTAFGQWWDAINERLFAGSASAAEKAASRAALEAGRELQPIAAAVASNALTLTLNPTSLDFRSATLGSGVINTRAIAAPLSLVVPAGATLGSVNGQTSRLTLLALDNGGAIELAVLNAGVGVTLDQGGVISTVAMSTTSDNSNTAYSQTARSNLPYRVLGFVESTQATAGDWATAPSLIQGMGPGISPFTGSVAQLLTGNGYQRLPGGLILQWGTVASVSTNTVVTLPIAFPNAILAVVGSDSESTAAGYVAWQALSSSQIRGTSNGAFQCSYIAIGF